MLRITTLLENRAGDHHGLRSEHGLSFYIEKDGSKILFDTGQSDAFIHNAAQMCIDLSAVDCAVLSHGHYDHSGGFRYLADRGCKPHLMIGTGFFNEKYGVSGNCCHYLGNNFNESFLKYKGISWTTVFEDLKEIAPDIFILSNFPRIHPEEVPNPRFMVRRNGNMEQDSFSDEILIAIRTSGGLAVLLGCSHPGVLNMLETVKTRLKAPIKLILGGTHLVEAHGDRLEKSLKYLLSEKAIIGVSHCTGKEALEKLKLEDSSFLQNVTGSTVFLE